MFLRLLFILLYSFALTSQDSCSIVRQQFIEMELGSGTEVPYAYRSTAGICSSGSCCSTEMERSFMKRVKRDYASVSRTYFEHVYHNIKQRTEHYQMSIERYILHNARLSLKTCSEIHNSTSDAASSHSRQKQSVIDVYSNITRYFTQVDRRKETTVRKMVKSFVEQNMEVKKFKSVGCLKAVSNKLEKALNAAWMVKESLKFARSLFGSIRQWRISENCIEALVQMNYCSLCNPNYVYQLTQPCSKFCVNVHKGCLAPILQISPKITEWSRLLQYLLTELRYDRGLYDAVTSLNDLVHSTLVSETVEDICEHPVYTLPPDESQLTLDYHLVRLQEELELYEKSFDTLPYRLCDSQHFSQPGSENHCWNGTAMSTYNCHVSDSGLYAPNPTQIVMGDPMLTQQEARLREIVAMLYQETGIIPSPTPPISLQPVDLCWEHTESDEDNMSDKRDHVLNSTTDLPYPGAQSSSLGCSSSSPFIPLLIIATICAVR